MILLSLNVRKKLNEMNLKGLRKMKLSNFISGKNYPVDLDNIKHLTVLIKK